MSNFLIAAGFGLLGFCFTAFLIPYVQNRLNKDGADD